MIPVHLVIGFGPISMEWGIPGPIFGLIFFHLNLWREKLKKKHPTLIFPMNDILTWMLIPILLVFWQHGHPQGRCPVKWLNLFGLITSGLMVKLDVIYVDLNLLNLPEGIFPPCLGKFGGWLHSAEVGLSPIVPLKCDQVWWIGNGQHINYCTKLYAFAIFPGPSA